MHSLNLNYLRGLYEFLLGKSDEWLESFDINSATNQADLIEKMKIGFSKFGPTSKANVVRGLHFMLINYSDDCLWRKAIPHDLPLDRVVDRKAYLEKIILGLTGSLSCLEDLGNFLLIDEVGVNGLNYSE